MSATTTESGLSIEEIRVGDGDTAASGQFVSVHYTGWLADGIKFDSSRDRNESIEFPLGQRHVIDGWGEGVQGMRVDGERVTELGTRADPSVKIALDAQACAAQQRQMTILPHKPVDYVSGQPEPGCQPAIVLIRRENQRRSPDTPICLRDRRSPFH